MQCITELGKVSILKCWKQGKGKDISDYSMTMLSFNHHWQQAVLHPSCCRRMPEWQRPLLTAFQQLLRTTAIGRFFFSAVAQPQASIFRFIACSRLPPLPTGRPPDDWRSPCLSAIQLFACLMNPIAYICASSSFPTVHILELCVWDKRPMSFLPSIRKRPSTKLAPMLCHPGNWLLSCHTKYGARDVDVYAVGEWSDIKREHWRV